MSLVFDYCKQILPGSLNRLGNVLKIIGRVLFKSVANFSDIFLKKVVRFEGHNWQRFEVELLPTVSFEAGIVEFE